MFSGNGKGTIASTPNETLFPYTAGKYWLRSNGLQSQIIYDYDLKPWSSVVIEIHPQILRSFAASPEGELPENLQHLVRPPSQEICVWSRNITPMMAGVLQQILNCPYKGMVKRAYLESKVVELMALVLDQEIAIGQGELKKVFLKPDQLERIHYAKEILLRDLSNPPSLMVLAHQAGLNEFMLKQGFRHCFNSTVFGELRSHRLELAKQLLAEQDISVAEVARQVGYASMSYFSTAFKRKFGIGPKAYQQSCR